MSAPVLSTSLDLGSPEAQKRAAHNRILAKELRSRVAKAALGGDERSRERHVGRGKLLPRDRVERLLDPGSPFLEIGQLAATIMNETLSGAPRESVRSSNLSAASSMFSVETAVSISSSLTIRVRPSLART